MNSMPKCQVYTSAFHAGQQSGHALAQTSLPQKPPRPESGTSQLLHRQPCRAYTPPPTSGCECLDRRTGIIISQHQEWRSHKRSLHRLGSALIFPSPN